MAQKLGIEAGTYQKIESGKTKTWGIYLSQLLEIFEIWGFGFFQRYGWKKFVQNNKGKSENTQTNLGDNNYHTDEKMFSLLEKQIDFLKKQIEEKDKLIEKLLK